MRPLRYLSGNRRGHAAHQTELEAMRDPLLAEAIEGFEAVAGNHEQAIAALEQRIRRRATRGRRLRLLRFAAAAAILLAAVTVGFIALRHESAPDYPTVAAASDPATTPHAQPSEAGSTQITPPSAEKSPIKANPTVSKPQTPTHEKTDPAATSPANDKPADDAFGDSTIDINDVVVTAYGVGRKKDITGSVSGQQQKHKGGQNEAPPEEIQHNDTPNVPEAESAEDSPAKDGTQQNAGFATHDTFPTFEGGSLDKLQRWVEQRMPQSKTVLANGLPGRQIVLSMVIDTLGRITDIRILQSPDRTLSAEAVRILQGAPPLTPAYRAEQKVAIKCIIRIDIRPDEAHDQRRSMPQADSAQFAEVRIAAAGERWPQFEGHELPYFRKWARQQMNYTESIQQRGIRGRVVVQFTIDARGRLGQIEVLDAPHRELTREVVRVLRRSPRWEPGTRNGEPVRMTFVEAFDFR